MLYKPEQFEPYMDIDESEFAVVKREGKVHDKKLDTKPVGYFRDAMSRFARNRRQLLRRILRLRPSQKQSLRGYGHRVLGWELRYVREPADV